MQDSPPTSCPPEQSDEEQTVTEHQEIEKAVSAAIDELDGDNLDEQRLERRLRREILFHLDAPATGSDQTSGPDESAPTSASELLDADTLLETIAPPAFVLAPDHTLVAYNDGLSELLGIGPEEALGEDYRETVSYAVYADGRRELSLADKVVEAPRDADGVFDSVERVENRTEYTGEFVYEDTATMRNKLGEEIPIGFIATPVFDDNGSLAAVLEVVEERESAMEEFPGLAGIISHDLRNPLEVVKSYTELAADDIDDEYAERIEENIERMETIIDDVMALSRQADAEHETDVLNLSLLAEQAWETVETSDATLVTEQVTATGDRAQLLRLFENLFRNAVEHGGRDVTVRVGLLADREGFFVADDGEGIPPDERDAVLEHGHSTNEDGTGFGLSIVHQIVQNHGWKMDVTDSEDGGARFEVIFAV